MLPDQLKIPYSIPAGRLLNEQCVAIVELGGNTDIVGINAYCKTNGYLLPNIVTTIVGGVVPTFNSNADGEVDLDVCMVAGIAQGCTILMVYAPNTGTGIADGIRAAANHPLNPCAISLSWGASLNTWADSDRQTTDSAIQYANSKGAQVFCASGDGGANDGESSPIVDYPAASPYAIGCGGTKLVLDSNGQRLNELAWTDNAQGTNGSSGGGFTTIYSKPSYQSNISIVPGRCVPDIAGNADPTTGFEVDVDGQTEQFGGTSDVAPTYAAVWAIIISRLGQRVSNLLPTIYSDPTVTLDVIGGNNGAYNCIKGYDLVSGMGTLNGEALLASLAKSNNLTILDPLPAQPVTPTPVPQPSLWQQFWAFITGWFQPAKPAFLKKHVVKKCIVSG